MEGVDHRNVSDELNLFCQYPKDRTAFGYIFMLFGQISDNH